MLGQRERLFGLPVKLFLVLMFIAIFITVIFILTPKLGGSWVAYLFNGLKELAKWLGVF
ncbi:MAG: hypothetical protein GTN40_04935 [Candidatus Aenigmarchaeota archaeon]|nr:hypothetical protein [Candidatus Aenigmarchaeota archaeon]